MNLPIDTNAKLKLSEKLTQLLQGENHNYYVIHINPMKSGPMIVKNSLKLSFVFTLSHINMNTVHRSEIYAGYFMITYTQY